MIKVMNVGVPIIDINIRDYILSLPDGHHCFVTVTNADINTVGQPATGRGFSYECIKKNNVAVVKATRFTVTESEIYMMKYYSDNWSNWTIVNQSGGGNTSLEMSPFRKRGGVNVQDCTKKQYGQHRRLFRNMAGADRPKSRSWRRLIFTDQHSDVRNHRDAGKARVEHSCSTLVTELLDGSGNSVYSNRNSQMLSCGQIWFGELRRLDRSVIAPSKGVAA